MVVVSKKKQPRALHRRKIMITLPVALDDQLDQWALERGLSRGVFIQQLLENYGQQQRKPT